jgi:hypothetical protein
MDINRKPLCPRRTRFWLLALLLAAAVLAPAAAPRHVAAQESADMVVVVWPTPGIQVTPGGLLTYQVQVKNFNRSSKSNIRVYLPYHASQLAITGVEFEGEDDWVSELSEVHMVLVFPYLAGSETRTATIYARVADYLPYGTVINSWPSYSWDDSRSEDHPHSANAAPVLVGPEEQHSALVWLAVEPTQGTSETRFSFFSDRFLPHETVEAALVVPGGETYHLGRRTTADAQGRIWLEVPGRDIPPGTFQLLVTGLSSNLQGATTFIVTE